MCFILNGWPGGQRRDRRGGWACPGERFDGWTKGVSRDETRAVPDREQVEAGKYVVVGPALDQGRIGGMAIINAASMEEAQKVVNADKMVQSGHLTAETHPVMLADLSAPHIEYPAKAGK